MTQQVEGTNTAPAVDASLTHAPLPSEPSATASFDPTSPDEVLGMEDPGVRTLWIAQRYHELAGRLTPFLGVDHSWCTFAVWRTLGMHRFLGTPAPVPPGADASIAGIDRRLRPLRRATAVDGDVFGRVVGGAWDDVGRRVRLGHDQVFAQLAPPFERLTRLLEAGTHRPDRDAVVAELGVAAAGPPVRVAFGQYFSAVHDTDAVRRAQRILAANLLLALHGEKQIQTHVGAPVDRARDAVDDLLGRVTTPSLPLGWRRWAVAGPREVLAQELAAQWDRALDEGLLTFAGPVRDSDLRAEPAPEWPAALQVPSISVLAEILDQWAGTDGTGGQGWSDLDRRMWMLEGLYRSRQQADGLASAPFTRRQLEAMRRGQVPASPAS